jgi:FMN-dependent NADH-azoreductase
MRILEINASGRHDGSASRRLSAELADVITRRYDTTEITRRDLADGVPFIDAGWIDAAFTPADERSEAQRAALAESDRLVDEILEADVLVIGTPMYNFGPPAALKAWIDMIARAGLTFRYTQDGPVGLVNGKKAYVVVATGGVAVDSDADFLTPWLRQMLDFVGITDVEFIVADRLQADDGALAAARRGIAAIATVSGESGGREQRVA